MNARQKQYDLIAHSTDRWRFRQASRLAAVLVALLALVSFARGQSELPEIGSIADIRGKTKVYIVADGEARKAMIKKLSPAFSFVDKPADAEFFLEYKQISRGPVGGTGMTLETGQIDAYYYRDKTKVIAWSDSKTGGGFKGDAARVIAGKFLKAYRKD